MIKLTKPTLKRKDMDAVLNSMVDESICPGERNTELAFQIKEYIGAEKCMMLRSYTKALEAACKLLNLGEGDKVAISPLSPAWYVEVLKNLKCEILFADVDPVFGCISADSVKTLIPKGISAVIIHTPFGNLPEYGNLSQVSVPVIEDITQSFGSRRVEEKRPDNVLVTIVGLEEDSVVTTGGGAAVMVYDRKFIKPLDELFSISGGLELLPDLNAALGIAQMKALKSLLERRREYLYLFKNAISKTRHRLLMEDSETYYANGHILPVLLDSRVKEVNKFTRRYKIETRNPFEVCAMDMHDIDQSSIPNSMPFKLRTILFPLYPMLSNDQLKTIVKVLSTLP